MRYVKLFEQFKSNQEIDEICKEYMIKNYTINDDNSIDVNGDVYLNFYDFSELPLKFRNVSGYFSCSNNELTTLEGSPRIVGKGFNCSNNKLEYFYGCPHKIDGALDCYGNVLYNFDSFPEMLFGELNLPTRLNFIYEEILLSNIDNIYTFNDYNIIKAPKNKLGKPRLKLSNLNKYLNDFNVKEFDMDELEMKFDVIK